MSNRFVVAAFVKTWEHPVLDVSKCYLLNKTRTERIRKGASLPSPLNNVYAGEAGNVYLGVTFVQFHAEVLKKGGMFLRHGLNRQLQG